MANKVSFFLVWIGKYFALVGLLFLAFGIYFLIRAIDINQNWLETTATIEQVESKVEGRETRYFYHIVYQTEDGPTVQTVLGRNEHAPFGLVSVLGNNGESEDLGLRAGQTMLVRYAPSNPSYSVDASLIWRVPLICLIVGVVLLSLMFLMIILGKVKQST